MGIQKEIVLEQTDLALSSQVGSIRFESANPLNLSGMFYRQPAPCYKQCSADCFCCLDQLLCIVDRNPVVYKDVYGKKVEYGRSNNYCLGVNWRTWYHGQVIGTAKTFCCIEDGPQYWCTHVCNCTTTMRYMSVRDQNGAEVYTLRRKNNSVEKLLSIPFLAVGIVVWAVSGPYIFIGNVCWKLLSLYLMVVGGWIFASQCGCGIAPPCFRTCGLAYGYLRNHRFRLYRQAIFPEIADTIENETPIGYLTVIEQIDPPWGGPTVWVVLPIFFAAILGPLYLGISAIGLVLLCWCIYMLFYTAKPVAVTVKLGPDYETTEQVATQGLLTWIYGNNKMWCDMEMPNGVECFNWSYDEHVFMAPMNYVDFETVTEELQIVKEEEKMMPVTQEHMADAKVEQEALRKQIEASGMSNLGQTAEVQRSVQREAGNPKFEWFFKNKLLRKDKAVAPGSPGATKN